MNDVVERVARAMLRDELSRTGPQHNFDAVWDNEREAWLRNARSAIQDMLTPSPEMIAAGELALSNEGVDNVGETDAIACWSAMLSAALADASPDIGKEGKPL